MGTAPGTSQLAAMPHADRSVTETVAVLMRLGLPEADALIVVLQASARIRAVMVSRGITDLAWIKSVMICASDRLAVLPSSHTDRTENTNADGRSSRRSGHQGGQEA